MIDQKKLRREVLLNGLRLETKSILVRRGESCYSIVKREYGLKGSKKRVLEQFEALVKSEKALDNVSEYVTEIMDELRPDFEKVCREFGDKPSEKQLALLAAERAADSFKVVADFFKSKTNLEATIKRVSERKK